MVYRSRGSDWGSFSKGFSEAFAAMMKLAEDKRHNEALEAHWARLDQIALANNPYANGVFGSGKGGFREGSGGSSYGAPRGVRNNNPGNIKDGDFAKSQPGYMGSDGTFAKFDSVANGTSALDNLLVKNYSGLTVAQLINKYAPPSENNSSAYANSVAKRLGIDVNSVPNLNDQDVRNALRYSIVSIEQGIPF